MTDNKNMENRMRRPNIYVITVLYQNEWRRGRFQRAENFPELMGDIIIQAL